MSDAGLKDVVSLLERLEKERNVLQSKIEDMKLTLDKLNKKIEAAELIVNEFTKESDTSMFDQTYVQDNFRNLTYPQILVKLAEKQQGLLKVTDAVSFLLKIGTGTDKRNIQANIYSSLKRMQGNFRKIAPGQYRFTNHMETVPPKRESSGIREVIKKLKEANPQMTKQEVLRYLRETKFDFKGKRETSAVNITWAKLGYFKEGKQQSLPGVN